MGLNSCYKIGKWLYEEITIKTDYPKFHLPVRAIPHAKNAPYETSIFNFHAILHEGWYAYFASLPKEHSTTSFEEDLLNILRFALEKSDSNTNKLLKLITKYGENQVMLALAIAFIDCHVFSPNDLTLKSRVKNTLRQTLQSVSLFQGRNLFENGDGVEFLEKTTFLLDELGEEPLSLSEKYRKQDPILLERQQTAYEAYVKTFTEFYLEGLEQEFVFDLYCGMLFYVMKMVAKGMLDTGVLNTKIESLEQSQNLDAENYPMAVMLEKLMFAEMESELQTNFSSLMLEAKFQ